MIPMTTAAMPISIALYQSSGPSMGSSNTATASGARCLSYARRWRSRRCPLAGRGRAGKRPTQRGLEKLAFQDSGEKSLGLGLLLQGGVRSVDSRIQLPDVQGDGL